MKRIDKKIKRVIENNPSAFATVNNNKPNVIGVAYIKVVSKNQIIITDNYMKSAIINLKKNKKVGLAVWDKKWNGYKLNGTARYFTSGKWKKFVEEMKENKEMPAKGAILVTINEIKKLA